MEWALGAKPQAPLGPLHASVRVAVISGFDFHYSGEKLLSQLFSTENNFSIHALSRELLIQAFSCSPFYIIYNKMDKVFREPSNGDLHPITHKEFNEFIKGKGF